MSDTTNRQGGSLGTTLMGVVYLGLLAFCVWAADDGRANYASACQRLGNGCASAGARS
jgi:hypothetical protein